MKEKNDKIGSQELVLETHLCCFGEQVIELCDRESDCLISPQAAYQEIRSLWLQLTQTQPEIVNYVQDLNHQE